MKKNCSVNTLRLASQLVYQRDGSRSSSSAGSLNAMVSYGEAANRRYCHALSAASTRCSYADMKRWRGCRPSSISGYSTSNSSDRAPVSASRCFTTRYPGRPIRILRPALRMCVCVRMVCVRVCACERQCVTSPWQTHPTPLVEGPGAGSTAAASRSRASLAARLPRFSWCRLPCVCAR